MGRLLTVLFVFGWYIAVRSIVFYHFLGYWNGTNRQGNEFFEWWWSWFFAIPLSAFTLGGLIGFFFIVVPWVFDGFSRRP